MIHCTSFYIEPISLEDANGIFQLVSENKEAFNLYLPVTTGKNNTLENSKSFVENKVAKFLNKEQFLFVLKEHKTNIICGLVYIKDLDWKQRQAEYGYCLATNKNGLGWMTEAIKKLSMYAFEELKLQRLVIKVHKTNIGSVKVAQKCGFKWKETLLNEFKPKDRPAMDMELYVLEK